MNTFKCITMLCMAFCCPCVRFQKHKLVYDVFFCHLRWGLKGIHVDSCDDILEEDFRCQRVAMVDHWFPFITIPTVHWPKTQQTHCKVNNFHMHIIIIIIIIIIMLFIPIDSARFIYHLIKLHCLEANHENCGPSCIRRWLVRLIYNKIIVSKLERTWL